MGKRIILSPEDVEQVVNEDHEDFEVIDQWVEDAGKYQHLTWIVKHIPTGDTYRGTATRSGSYFTDYDYDYDPDLVQVYRTERVVEVWEDVKEFSIKQNIV